MSDIRDEFTEMMNARLAMLVETVHVKDATIAAQAERIAELEGDFASARTSREYWSAKAFELQATLNADAERIAELDGSIKEWRDSEAQLQKRIAALTAQRGEIVSVEEIEKRIAQALYDNSIESRAQIADRDAQIAEQNAWFDDANRSLSALRAENAELREQLRREQSLYIDAVTGRKTFRQMYRDEKKQADALREQLRWRDASKESPTEIDTYACRETDGEFEVIKCSEWRGNFFNSNWTVTHWLPLPPLPNEVKS